MQGIESGSFEKQQGFLTDEPSPVPYVLTFICNWSSNRKYEQEVQFILWIIYKFEHKQFMNRLFCSILAVYKNLLIVSYIVSYIVIKMTNWIVAKIAWSNSLGVEMLITYFYLVFS